MKVPRICTNEGCLQVVPAKALKYGQDDEDNRKLDVIDSQIKCPKCNAKLTQYIHKVWDHVKDDEEVCKIFGVVTNDAKKVTEAKQTTYKTAKNATEEHRRKMIEDALKKRA